MPLSFLFLMTALVWGFGTPMFASKAEGKSPVLKTERLSSQPTASGGVSMRVLWTISEYKVGESAVWGKRRRASCFSSPLT